MRLPFLITVTLALSACLSPAPAQADRWTPPTLVAPRADVQFDFAMGADGTAAAVWERDGIRVVVKRPGHRWSAPRRASDGHHVVGRPAVAVTGRGEVVVAWTQSATRAAGRPIYGPLTIRSRARGASGRWGTERQLGTTAHFIEAGIDLAANERGETIAVWRGVRRLSARRRADAVQSAFRRPGNAFGGAQAIREPQARRAGVTGQVVVLDERGTAHAAWSLTVADPVVRLASRSRGARGAWGTPRTIGGRPSSNPVIAVGADGNVTIAWRAARLNSEGDGIQSGALDVRTRSTSGALTSTQRVSDAPTSNYRLAAGPLGRAVLAWSGRDSDPPTPGVADLRVATRATASGLFAAPEVVAGVKPADFHGSPVILPDGTVLFAWSDVGRTRVITRPPGGRFAPDAELDVPGLYPLIVAAADRVVIAWNGVSGDDVALQAAVRYRDAR